MQTGGERGGGGGSNLSPKTRERQTKFRLRKNVKLKAKPEIMKLFCALSRSLSLPHTFATKHTNEVCQFQARAHG